MQQLLIRAGYGTLLGSHQDDAVFGPDTKNAVEQFQRDHKLTDDGIIGAHTLPALEAAAAKKTTSQLPESAMQSVDEIKAKQVTLRTTTAVSADKNAKAPRSYKASPSRVMTTGEVRLAQSYLRVMDYFGPMNDIPGITVVHGKLDQQTRNVFDRFSNEHGATYHLTSGAPTVNMLHAIQQEHDVFLQQKNKAASHRINPAAEVQRGALAQQFSTHKTEFAKHFAKIESLHPVMRFPVMKAIQELESKHIHVLCVRHTVLPKNR